MKLWHFFVCFFLSHSLLFAEPSYKCVTYSEVGGRLGDWLIAYVHAKWISFRDGVPLIYEPFLFSSDLILSQKEMSIEDANQKQLLSSIYRCPYFPESKPELGREEARWRNRYFPVDLENKEFRAVLKEMIAPNRELELIHPPPYTINIAIHVREGGGYDLERSREDAPEKVPPISFYSIGLNKILELFKERAIYCHVFTDALNPQSIVEGIKASLIPGQSITWGYREKDNHCSKNVLEDMFSLCNFDILIRPESNLSMIASIIHDHAILCTPTCFSIPGKTVFTGEVNIKINQDLLEELLLSSKGIQNFKSL